MEQETLNILAKIWITLIVLIIPGIVIRQIYKDNKKQVHKAISIYINFLIFIIVILSFIMIIIDIWI